MQQLLSYSETKMSSKDIYYQDKFASLNLNY